MNVEVDTGIRGSIQLSSSSLRPSVVSDSAVQRTRMACRVAEHLLPTVDARGPSVVRASSQSVLLRGARRHCSVLLPTVFNGARIGARCVLMRS